MGDHFIVKNEEEAARIRKGLRKKMRGVNHYAAAPKYERMAAMIDRLAAAAASHDSRREIATHGGRGAARTTALNTAEQRVLQEEYAGSDDQLMGVLAGVRDETV